MDRRHSLRGRRAFTRLHREGRRWKEGEVRVRYLLESVDTPRFAISVPRACGCAVVRNRMRRVWGEALRLSLDAWPAGVYHLMLLPVPTLPTLGQASGILRRFRSSLDG